MVAFMAAFSYHMKPAWPGHDEARPTGPAPALGAAQAAGL